MTYELENHDDCALEPLEDLLRFLTREINSLGHWAVRKVPKVDGMMLDSDSNLRSKKGYHFEDMTYDVYDIEI
jgi:hypothetical protein